jgi:hypothetical protein
MWVVSRCPFRGGSAGVIILSVICKMRALVTDLPHKRVGKSAECRHPASNREAGARVLCCKTFPLVPIREGSDLLEFKGPVSFSERLLANVADLIAKWHDFSAARPPEEPVRLWETTVIAVLQCLQASTTSAVTCTLAWPKRPVLLVTNLNSLDFSPAPGIPKRIRGNDNHFP